MPVSYTHLDVYKRQPQTLPKPSLGPLPAPAPKARKRPSAKSSKAEMPPKIANFLVTELEQQNPSTSTDSPTPISEPEGASPPPPLCYLRTGNPKPKSSKGVSTPDGHS